MAERKLPSAAELNKKATVFYLDKLEILETIEDEIIGAVEEKGQFSLIYELPLKEIAVAGGDINATYAIACAIQAHFRANSDYNVEFKGQKDTTWLDRPKLGVTQVRFSWNTPAATTGSSGVAHVISSSVDPRYE